MDAATGLLAGGALTSISLAWSHVKNLYTKVSSGVIQRAVLDERIRYVVFVYLRAHYKTLPNAKGNYKHLPMILKGSQYTSIVPFKATWANATFYNNRSVIRMTSNEIITIRGLIDYEKLIVKAIDYFETDYNQKWKEKFDLSFNTNMFKVITVMGREKGYATEDKGNKTEGPTAIEAKNDPKSREQMGGDIIPIDYHFDKSFKYDPSQYLYSHNNDPFDGLYFSQETLSFITRARRWYEKGDWYVQRNLPWRLGVGFYGPGGTGKSSLAKALAKYLDLPIYQYFLATLSDQEFLSNWRRMNTPCVILFEDFDTVFDMRESITPHKLLTFDCVLNAISGVDTLNGTLLILTTNHLEKIDPAMGVVKTGSGISTRPGRIDQVVELGYMSKENRYKMAKKILTDWPNAIEELVTSLDEVTPAQFQEACVSFAFERMNEEDNKQPVENVIDFTLKPKKAARRDTFNDDLGIDDDDCSEDFG